MAHRRLQLGTDQLFGDTRIASGWITTAEVPARPGRLDVGPDPDGGAKAYGLSVHPSPAHCARITQPSARRPNGAIQLPVTRIAIRRVRTCSGTICDAIRAVGTNTAAQLLRMPGQLHAVTSVGVPVFFSAVSAARNEVVYGRVGTID